MNVVYEGSCTNCGGKILVTDKAFLFHSEPSCGNSKSSPEDVAMIRAIIEKANADRERPNEEPGCKRCGKPLAYAGAVYCGAGCSARAESGE